MNAKILLPETCSAVVKTSFGSVGVWTPFEKIKAIHIFPGIFLEKNLMMPYRLKRSGRYSII